VRLVGFAVALWAIAGCGGGGGGSHSSGPSLVGRYLGTANTVIKGPTSSMPLNGSIQFDLAADNTVTVSDPGQAPFGSGTLSGNTVTVTAPGSAFNSPGVSCSGTVTFGGTISGTSLNGNISSGGVSCNGASFNISGTFATTLHAELPRSAVGSGI